MTTLKDSPPIVNSRPFVKPDMPYDLMRRHLWCFPGKSIFAVPKLSENDVRDSGLIISSRTASRFRLPVAVCVQAHPGTGLLPGETYIVHPRFAKRVKNLYIGRLRIPEEAGELWLFGCTSPARGTAYPVSPSRYAYARLPGHETDCVRMQDPNGCPFDLFPIETNRVGAGHAYVNVRGKLALHGKVALHLGKRAEVSPGGIVLCNSMQARADISLIESVSDRTKIATPGMYAWYQRRGLMGLGQDGDDFGCISEDGIFAAVDLHGLA